MIPISVLIAEAILGIIAITVLAVGSFLLGRFLEQSKLERATRQSVRWVAAGFIISVVDGAWDPGELVSELALLLAMGMFGLVLIEYFLLREKERRSPLSPIR